MYGKTIYRAKITYFMKLREYNIQVGMQVWSLETDYLLVQQKW